MNQRRNCPKCNCHDALSWHGMSGHWLCLYNDCNYSVGPDVVVPKLTKEQAAIIGLFTGVSCGPFADVQQLAEELTGRPIFTHEFARKETWDEVKNAVRPQFLALCYG